MRREMYEVMSEAILVRLMYAYRDVSTPELEAYLGFFDSDLGQWYADVLYDAMSAALIAFGERARSRFNELLAPR
jgi:hypothetical protein